MARHAVAQETVLALRRDIARIEGRLAETLAGPSPADATVLRCASAAPMKRGLLTTGAESFDAALGGGLPKAALTEIHTAETRDAGAASGFALALAALLTKGEPRPLLWIGAAEIFREAGLPYAPGLARDFGLASENLLFAEAPKLIDALWIAEEAARLTALSATILELRGNPGKLDLTATRRLHRRAIEAGRPVFLLRPGAWPEPTAAPFRFIVSPAPAALRWTVAGPLHGSIGPPSFVVAIDKSRAGQPGRFTLQWNPDEHSFQEKRPENPGAVVPLSLYGTGMAAAAGSLVAFEPAAEQRAARRQQPRKQRTKDRRARRAG